MVNWTKFFGKAFQILAAGDAGYNIHDWFSKDKPDQLAPIASIAQRALDLVKQLSQEIKEVEASLEAAMALLFLVVFGVVIGITIGIFSVVYSCIAKRTSRKVKKELGKLK